MWVRIFVDDLSMRCRLSALNWNEKLVMLFWAEEKYSDTHIPICIWIYT